MGLERALAGQGSPCRCSPPAARISLAPAVAAQHNRVFEETVSCVSPPVICGCWRAPLRYRRLHFRPAPPNADGRSATPAGRRPRNSGLDPARRGRRPLGLRLLPQRRRTAARTEAAARGQCGQPVVINRGPGGGVMMYLADSAQLQELRLKGSSERQELHRPARRRRRPAGPRDRVVRRPRHGAALDGSRGRRSLRHRRLCALRARRRRACAAGCRAAAAALARQVARLPADG